MDANWFNLRGIPSVGVATGYFKNHTMEEHLLIDDFHQAGGLVYRLIEAYGQLEK
jgi:tripeptide aminopeptidase